MKKKVVDVSSGEEHSFVWRSITWLHSGAFSGSEELTIGEVVIKAGYSNPMHTLANCEEALYLLEGELDHSCGDEPGYRLLPGSSIAIQRGIPHNAKCVSDCDARMIVAYSSPCRETNAE